MDTAERIKQLRKAQKLTQKELAERISVTKSMISFYENGERLPSYESLIKLASVFRVSTDYLLGLDRTAMLDCSGISKDDMSIIVSLIQRLRR